jgi:hypothetical protein
MTLQGCTASKPVSERKFSDVVNHLEKHGIKGEFQEKAFAMIGAAGGGLFTSEGVVVEVYHFQDVSKAKSMENTSSIGTYAYCKGNVVVLVFEGKDKVLKALEDF